MIPGGWGVSYRKGIGNLLIEGVKCGGSSREDKIKLSIISDKPCVLDRDNIDYLIELLQDFRRGPADGKIIEQIKEFYPR